MKVLELQNIFLPPFTWVLTVTYMLILNGILWSCGDITSDWTGDYMHMEKPGSLLEIQNLRSQSKPSVSETEFSKIPSDLYVH